MEAISLSESKRLGELEKIIQAGKQTFLEVGIALAEICERKLYKAEFSTFAEYTIKKWGWGKSYAYTLIESAKVVRALPQKVSTIVDNEAKARALQQVPEKKRAPALEKLAASGEPVTAKAIQKFAKPIPKKPKAEPKQPTDETGLTIPLSLREVWEAQWAEAQEMLGHISVIRSALKARQESDNPHFRELNFSSVLSNLNQAWEDIKRAKPYAVCPCCNGKLPNGECGKCSNRGWVSEFFWCGPFVLTEEKQMRAHAVSQQGKK